MNRFIDDEAEVNDCSESQSEEDYEETQREYEGQLQILGMKS